MLGRGRRLVNRLAEFRAARDALARARSAWSAAIGAWREPARNAEAASERRRYFELAARAALRSLLHRRRGTMTFPRHAAPVVSVIVLAWNKVEYTFRCLESLLAHADVPWELVVVDNASRDETPLLLSRLENVRVITNDTNVGFVHGGNQGAEVARGAYLLFLNNDALLTPNCLSLMVGTSEGDPACGAVGARVVWPDGRLQDAGNILWSDGTALGYGRGGDPYAPAHSYAREIDFSTGACLLVRTALFRDLGGFDERYAPAYYEDADLGMAIRARGSHVRYQPAAQVIHHEYTSSSPGAAGTLMVRNRVRFVEKWQRALQSQLPASPANVLRARDRSTQPRLLMIADRMPAERGGGAESAYGVLSSLASLPLRVTFAPLEVSAPAGPSTEELQQRGIEMVPGPLDLAGFAGERAELYEIVLVSEAARAGTIATVRRLFPKARVICDLGEVDAIVKGPSRR
jgi:GT2 family glycosyltransferase